MSKEKIDISVLLPTRGRTEALDRSLMTLLDLADDPSRVQILVGFDDDDQSSQEYFVENIQQKIDDRGAKFMAMEFPRLGYIRLNEYVNGLAAQATGEWLMFWNDDAVMETQGWDTKICERTGKFRVLRMPTHNLHPYAIFPIVPRKWYEMFGYLSDHQISDAWISQIGFLLDIVENIDVSVTHDRHDLTGNNGDNTYKDRIMLEGNVVDPRDFNHINWRQRRFSDARKIDAYLKEIGDIVPWFDDVCAGKQDPWAKMTGPEFDPNRQLQRFS